MAGTNSVRKRNSTVKVVTVKNNTVDALVAGLGASEGSMVSSYRVEVDIGSASWVKELDEVIVEYDFEKKVCYLRRRRIMVNPTAFD